MDTLTKFMPISVSSNQNNIRGLQQVEVTCQVVGNIDGKLIDDLMYNRKYLVAVSESEYINLSNDSKKLTLILQELLELKELIKK